MSARDWKAVVIGGSAGSVDILSKILPLLPATFPLPIMVVVHLPSDKKSVMAELLQNKCQLIVREAEDKEEIKEGNVYFAPPDYHLLVESNNRLSLSYDEPQLFSRPSIDVLFESAADAYGEKVIGVILSGANDDGARGLKMIISQGGEGLVQSPEEAYASAMPKAAIAASPEAKVMNAKQIGDFLKEQILK